MGDNIKEIYVHCNDIREKDHFKSIAYVPPYENFIDINTTFDSIPESFEKLLNAI